MTVLVSGGMDSMACVHFYKKKWANVEGVFISYGQKAALREEEATIKILSHLSIPFSIIRVDGLSPLISKTGFIQGRNIAFLILGLMYAQTKTGSIAIGIHSGTDYSDCSPDFVELSQRVFDLYTDGKFTVGAPFINWTKADILQYCRMNKLPLELSYSCELGLEQPCGKCKSCEDRKTLNVS